MALDDDGQPTAQGGLSQLQLARQLPQVAQAGFVGQTRRDAVQQRLGISSVRGGIGSIGGDLFDHLVEPRDL